ncbi:PSP [Macleaya cordata]|uniref:PSP n=1 Tax=Macleaya cordata TaxID=56857 RepID=A0A200Q3M2_MACCD|nr:PSP [Macleaya cordata]
MAQEPFRKTTYRLSKPLIGDDRRIYTCSDRNFFAFESNGSIAWSVHLNYSCHVDIAPIQDEIGKIYLVAENRILKIRSSNIGTSESTVEVFFGDKLTTGGSDEIIGMAISVISSSMFINVKNRGLFAYKLQGQRLWSAGPVLYRFGYRQGCKRNITDCFFTSAPVVDQCEGSVYISNTYAELYSLSVRNPQFKWIQDFSAFDKLFTITPGNNGLVYATFPVIALLLALDVSTGNIMWQKTTGPLSTTDCLPTVDSNGWISIGSLDGFLYSFSPSGVLRKFPKSTVLNSVVQVSPLLDCSGYAIYISQTVLEGRISQTIGEYTYISAMKPVNVVFTMLIPATGSVYWTETYTGQFSSFLSESDLHHFALDERILLAFVTSGSNSAQHNFPSSQIFFAGNERAILLFLLFQSLVLIILSGFVRFCCIFWRKKKLKDQGLGKFLEKRRSLRVKKKEFDRTITELEQKAAEEAMTNEVLEKLGDLVKEREGIERKLSTTYSLGRDKINSLSKSILPLYDEKAKSYSFQGRKKESVTIFHTLSDTSSRERTSSRSSSCSSSSNGSGQEETNWNYYEDKESAAKAKKEAQTDVGPSNSAGICEEKYWESSPAHASSSKGFTNPLYIEGDMMEPMQQGSSSKNIWLKRRRTLKLLIHLNMVPEDFIDLNASSVSGGGGGENNELCNSNSNPSELDSQPSGSQVREDIINEEKLGQGKCDEGNIEGQHIQDMELDEGLVEKPLILQESFKLDETVITTEKITKVNSLVNIENGFATAQKDSDISNHKIEDRPISGVKRARITYADQEPSVRVIYNSITSASKRKLEELLQQWSEWNAQHDSSNNKPHEALVSGEETYFPALHVGLEKASTVSFWMDNETRKEQTEGIIRLDGDSAPLYDRGYSLGLTSLDGSTSVERGLETLEASRCFNCNSYNHSLKECPKPRDNVAVNNARKQHNSKRSQNAGPHKLTRYYQNSSGGKYDGLRPGFLGPETRQLLGIGEFDPPPWLHRMREIGYPPGYLDLDDEDQASGITIFLDEKTKEDQEDGELSETDEPEPKKKMSVEFPGINAPIPENADERHWASLQGVSSFDPYRNRFNSNSGRSSEAINRGHHSDQRRRFREYRDDGPPGCDPEVVQSTSTFIPSYSGSDPNYATDTHSPRGNLIPRSPNLGRSLSDRGRSPLILEGSPNQSPYNTSAHSTHNTRHSPRNYSSASYDWAYSSNPNSSSELSSQRKDRYDRHHHQRR